MGTSIAELITDHAMVEINDVRLEQQLQQNAALFFRRMWLYVKNGVPLFNNPPEMRERLAYTAPLFADYEWIGAASAQPTVVSTNCVGYELMSVQVNEQMPDGNIVSTPYTEATYDSETGDVTFPDGIADGTVFQLDFYTDGQFENELNEEEKRILAICVALVWYERFSNDWLNMQPKIASKSFSVGSESNYIRAMTERDRSRRAYLFAEMNKYAQNVAYRNMIGHGGMSSFMPY